MNGNEIQWCSWCFEQTEHELIEKNYLSRNDYQCTECLNFTVQCRYCSNMATHKPFQPDSDKGIIDTLSQSWASECCAEHDGAIANFENLAARLNDISEFKLLFENKKLNLAAGGKIIGGMIAGVAVFGPLSYLAAPAIASSLGSLGLLGAASTGTAISTLSGAALTSASLAALGPGGMAGGVAFVSAVGAALGGSKGAVVSNNYFGAIENFNIIKVRDGNGPSVIFINGFLSQENQDASDWLYGIKDKYPNNPCYLVTWESSSLAKIGSWANNGLKEFTESFEKTLYIFLKQTAQKASIKFGPLTWAAFIANLIGNPWHTSMAKASMTGILLADIIARTKNEDGFVLMGHSLGCRVISYCLEALSTKPNIYINDVYLFGGAIDNSEKVWDSNSKSVKGKINNYHSDNDDILRYLFNGATLSLAGNPIGLKATNSLICNNIDVSEIVEGHMKYKDNISKILSV